MSASLKPVLGRRRYLRGMHQLESKISELQAQYQRLLKERQQEITHLLSAVDLVHLDDPLLAGGLLFFKEKTTSQDVANKSLVEAWRDAGEKFLRRTKSRTSFHSRNKDGKQPKASLQPHRQQKEAFSQISLGEKPSSKEVATHKTAPQSPQKTSREREA